MRRASAVLGMVAGVLLATGAAVVVYARHGGMSARQAPFKLESALAGRMVQLGLTREVRERKSPLGESDRAAAVSVGQRLYRANCEMCHGSDGNGVTPAGRGLLPPAKKLTAVALRDAGRTDGELFFLIRNGIRNTGMPAWELPDQDLWSLVAYLRTLPPSAAEPPQTTAAIPAGATYVGSRACQTCHAEIAARWAKTPMANVVRDPRVHPEAVLPDFSKPDPLLTFGLSEVALVYGSRWKQRYFKRVNGDFVALPAQWDITHAKWRPYFAKDDWWAKAYPPDNFQRPTGPLCDGCHSVNYNVVDKSVTEWNVGCERCHGPGSEHARSPSARNILDPARMDSVAANDVCISCHSQGRPLENPIHGQVYDWPVGYDVTQPLRRFWKLEAHTLGEMTFTHFADGTAHKNRMQGNDFVQSAMYTHGVTCSTCHDAHGTSYPSNLRAPAQELCLSCHGPGSANGPRAATLREHTHHAEGGAGSQCVGCHMPKIAQTIGDVNVRSHTFRPNFPAACVTCHADKSSAWAVDALQTWPSASPWRIP